MTKLKVALGRTTCSRILPQRSYETLVFYYSVWYSAVHNSKLRIFHCTVSLTDTGISIWTDWEGVLWKRIINKVDNKCYVVFTVHFHNIQQLNQQMHFIS
jgi:hypothetical protein